MSEKYSRHPMEEKFLSDREAHRIEQERVKLCYGSWLEQMDYDDTPDLFRAFLGGYAQGKFDASQAKQEEKA